MDTEKELILHIGLAKSGTSALQHYLTEHREELASQGICYPATGCAGRVAQHGIADACRSLLPYGRNLRDLRRAFETEIVPFEQVIVSSEGFQNLLFAYNLNYFFGGPDAGPRTSLFQWCAPSLRSRPYDITVVCYLREYLEFACSSYSQSVQNSDQTGNLTGYCAKQFRKPLSFLVHLWQRFSDDAVFVYYDRKRLFSRDIIQDFFSRIGRTPPEPSVRYDVNPSISGNLLAFKLLLNRKKCHSPKLYRTFSDLARLDPRYRGRMFLTDGLAGELRFRGRGYNAQLAQLVGPVEELSFENGNRFEAAMWRVDIERFLDHPGLAPLKNRREIYRSRATDVEALLGQ